MDEYIMIVQLIMLLSLSYDDPNPDRNYASNIYQRSPAYCLNIIKAARQPIQRPMENDKDQVVFCTPCTSRLLDFEFMSSKPLVPPSSAHFFTIPSLQGFTPDWSRSMWPTASCTRSTNALAAFLSLNCSSYSRVSSRKSGVCSTETRLRAVTVLFALLRRRRSRSRRVRARRY